MSGLPRPEALGPVDYASAVAPTGYHCGKCGVLGVKLWREYNTFLNHQSLLCAKCACAEQNARSDKGFHVIQRPDGGVDVRIDAGEEYQHYGDQIGWRIPAVPTADGETFWGYSSVPQDGCDWFNRLPLEVSP